MSRKSSPLQDVDEVGVGDGVGLGDGEGAGLDTGGGAELPPPPHPANSMDVLNAKAAIVWLCIPILPHCPLAAEHFGKLIFGEINSARSIIGIFNWYDNYTRESFYGTQVARCAKEVWGNCRNRAQRTASPSHPLLPIRMVPPGSLARRCCRGSLIAASDRKPPHAHRPN